MSPPIDPRPPADEILLKIGSLRKAITHAYSGDAEHGAFLRNGGGEYAPSPFLILDQLEAGAAALRHHATGILVDTAPAPLIENCMRWHEPVTSGGHICDVCFHAAPQWQDISRAPKDGTKILVLHQFDNSVCISYWGSIRGQFGWKSMLHNSECGSMADFCNDIAGWMPLPSPPAERGEA